jgi:hypothetical protein
LAEIAHPGRQDTIANKLGESRTIQNQAVQQLQVVARDTRRNLYPFDLSDFEFVITYSSRDGVVAAFIDWMRTYAVSHNPLRCLFLLYGRLAILLQGSISLFNVIAPSSALITGSLTRSVVGDRPSHPISDVNLIERTRNLSVNA